MVIIFELVNSINTLVQGFSRITRIGQRREQRVYILCMEGSFDIWSLASASDKYVASLWAQEPGHLKWATGNTSRKSVVHEILTSEVMRLKLGAAVSLFRQTSFVPAERRGWSRFSERLTGKFCQQLVDDEDLRDKFEESWHAAQERRGRARAETNEVIHAFKRNSLTWFETIPKHFKFPMEIFPAWRDGDVGIALKKLTGPATKRIPLDPCEMSVLCSHGEQEAFTCDRGAMGHLPILERELFTAFLEFFVREGIEGSLPHGNQNGFIKEVWVRCHQAYAGAALMQHVAINGHLPTQESEVATPGPPSAKKGAPKSVAQEEGARDPLSPPLPELPKPRENKRALEAPPAGGPSASPVTEGKKVSNRAGKRKATAGQNEGLETRGSKKKRVNPEDTEVDESSAPTPPPPTPPPPTPPALKRAKGGKKGQGSTTAAKPVTPRRTSRKTKK